MKYFTEIHLKIIYRVSFKGAAQVGIKMEPWHPFYSAQDTKGFYFELC